MVATGPDPGPIGPVDLLLSETFRTATGRAGHVLPLIVLFVISFGLVSSALLWLGLRDTVITFDAEATEPPVIEYGGSGGALAGYLALVPLSLLAAAIVRAACTRQVWAAQAESPEPWSRSLAVVGRRWRPFLAGTLGRWFVYLVIGGGFLVIGALIPLAVLAFPLVGVLLVFVWLRLSLVDQAAMLGPPGVRPLAVSWEVSGRQPARLFLRLLVLVLMAVATVLVISLIGSIFTAIAGAEGGAPLDPDALTYDLNAALGDNVAMFVLSALFGSLALGAAYVLLAAGATLLYRNLGGPTAIDLVDDPAPGPVEGQPVWETGR